MKSHSVTEMKKTGNSQNIGNLTLDTAVMNMNELQLHLTLQRYLRNKTVRKEGKFICICSLMQEVFNKSRIVVTLGEKKVRDCEVTHKMLLETLEIFYF